MAQDKANAPRVAPGPVKGSGRRAPWIILAVLLTAVLAILVSIVLAFWMLKS